MSAISIKHEFRTVLEIPASNRKITRTGIQRMVRQTEFLVKETKTQKSIYIDNQITIGTYTIRLLLSETAAKCPEPHHLSDYNGFAMRVFQTGRDGQVEVKMIKNSLFEDQTWVQRNAEFDLRITDLISAIVFFMRLDRLKAFN